MLTFKRILSKLKSKNSKTESHSIRLSESSVAYSPLLYIPDHRQAPSFTADQWEDIVNEPTVGEAPISSTPTSYQADMYHAGWIEYLMYLWKSVRTKGDPDARREAKVLFFEWLRHVDFVNDGLILVRAYSNCIINPNRTVSSACILLTYVYLSSWATYLLRGVLIYQRIPPNEMSFRPIDVFSDLKKMQGIRGRANMIMYEKLQWTYVTVNRFMEDLPQLMIVACLLGDNYDNYFVFGIAFSILIFALSSFRIGMAFPFKSSVKLMLRKVPAVHLADVAGTAPLTVEFVLFLAVTLILGGLVCFCCAILYTDNAIRELVYVLNSIFWVVLGVAMYFYWVYLEQERNEVPGMVERLPEIDYSDANNGKQI